MEPFMPSVAVNSEAEWLTLREMNIGGSEAAALFSTWIVDGVSHTFHAYEDIPEGAIYAGSCSPYSNAYKLFLNKTGKLMPEDFSGERIQAGQFMEPAIAEWARTKFDMKLRKVRRYHLHPDVQGWGASVDYEVHGPGMDPVELKNVDGLIAKRDWVIEGDEVVQTPLHIILQLQHYMAARSAERGWIIACIGGNQLVRGEFKPHEPTQARIREAIEAFWRGVAEERPPYRAAEYADVAEENAFGGGFGTQALDLTTDHSITTLANRYVRVKRHMDFIETHLENLKGQIAARVGGYARANLPAHKVTWPIINREAKLIPARQQEAKTYRGGFTLTPKKG
jgi:predicted phage-related endonuclease